MDKEKLLKILEIICNKIGKEDFSWRLDGSANLLMGGMDATPQDLDIRTWKDGIAGFKKCLKDYIIKDYYNDQKEAFSIIADILGEEVEINYYDKCDGDKDLIAKKIKINNLEVPCLHLKDAEKFYRRIGRTEKADKIKEFLDLSSN